MSSKAQKDRGWLLPEQVKGHPVMCVNFEAPDTPEYRAAIHGAVLELTRWWNWEKSWQSGDTRARDAAQIFMNLISRSLTFDETCSEAPTTSGCREIPLDSPIIEWNPNDPFITPDLVPSGYAFPPWYKANSVTGVTLGTSLGDIVTDITRTISIPIIPPASGFPRLRLHLVGSGTVEFRLVQLNAGGYVQITTDDDILSVEIFALNKDVISIPPETTDDVIIEREITGAGNHHIDLLFIPRVNDELLPPVTQGGAIRGIKLCGFDETVICKECPPETECDEDQIIDDWIGENFPDYEDEEEIMEAIDCIKPFIGQIVAGVVPPTSAGWLSCEGQMVSKAIYPQLYAILQGKTSEDGDLFALPDFRLKVPIGIGLETGQPEGYPAVEIETLQDAGDFRHQLNVSMLPSHSHTIGSHTHTTQAHNHIQDAHGHLVQDSGHSHTVQTRSPGSAFGTGHVAQQDNAVSNATRGTSTNTTGVSIVQTVATNQAATVIVDAKAAYQSENTGDNAFYGVMQPVIGVIWFIFAGCGGC